MVQLSAWLSAAMIPTLLQTSSGTDWLMALIVSGVCGGMLYVSSKWGRTPQTPLLMWLQYLYIIVLIVNLLPYTAYSWPGNNDPGVPLIILALAVWSANKGAQAAARVGCVLFWLVLLIYLVVLALGTAQVKPEWLRLRQDGIPWQGVTLLLVPCGALLMTRKTRGWNAKLLLPAVFWIVAAMVVTGVLSASGANNTNDPLYTTVRSLALRGIDQRFEPLLSAGMTVGWFAVITILLSMAAGSAEAVRPTASHLGLWSAGAVATVGVLCNLHISWWIMAILASVFWVAMPLLTQGLVRLKKM